MIYFDNSATSNPKPQKVIKNVVFALENLSVNPGRAGHRLSLEGSRILFSTRETIKEFVGGKSVNEIAFTSGGTEGLNLAIKGSLSSGDHVVTTVAEHNSTYRPLTSLEEKGVEYTIASAEEDGYTSLESVQKAVKKNTKAVVLNHISNLTGIVQPLEEIGRFCNKQGILLIVDGSQSCGYFDYRSLKEKVGILIATGHKSLLGPQGTGFVRIGNPDGVRPLKYGGTGSESESIYQPMIAPDKFESGTQNLPGIYGLAAGIEYINEMGLENYKKKKDELRNHFVEEVRKIPSVKLYGDKMEHSYGPVIALNVGARGSSDISFFLDQEYGIMTRSGLHCAPMLHRHMNTLEQGAVRFSFGHENTHEEITIAIKALWELAKKTN